LKFSAAASKKRMGFEKRLLVTQSRGQAALETQNFGHTTPCKADPRGFERPRGESSLFSMFRLTP